MAVWIAVVLSVVAGLGCGQSAGVSSGKFKCTVNTTINSSQKPAFFCVCGVIAAGLLMWFREFGWREVHCCLLSSRLIVTAFELESGCQS